MSRSWRGNSKLSGRRQRTRSVVPARNQPDIGVTLERIEMVPPPCHKVTTSDRNPVRSGFLFDFSDDLPTRGEGGGGVRILRHGGIDARGHVLDGLEHVEFEIEAFDLLDQRARPKPSRR